MKGTKRKRAPHTKGPCEHGVKYRSNCKVCSACPHGRWRRRVQGVRWCRNLRARSYTLSCKECGGSQICEHGRQRSQCKECGGASICEHGRIRSKCKECRGVKAKAEAELLDDVDAAEQGAKRKRAPHTKGACEHGVKPRSKCKVCGACPHGRRQRSRCKECGGSGICEHGRQRAKCKECGGSQICEHGRIRYSCKECGGCISASTVVSALHARSAVVHQSASTVVRCCKMGGLRARSLRSNARSAVANCEHGRSALNARSAVVHQSASTVVSALSARSATGRLYLLAGGP